MCSDSGKSQIMGFFGISRNFLGVIYFKRVSNDFRPLSGSVYIAECPDSLEASVRRIASGLSGPSFAEGSVSPETAGSDSTLARQSQL